MQIVLDIVNRRLYGVNNMKRTCKKCGETKELEGGFLFSKAQQKYPNYTCKSCLYEYRKNWCGNNPQHREKSKERNTRYREKNRGRLRQKRKENPERYRAYAKKWRDNNPEKCKKHYYENIGKCGAQFKRWRKNNHERYKELNRIHGRKIVKELRTSYIKAIIKMEFGINHEDVTPEMIVIKRNQVALKRLIIQAKRRLK